MSEFKRLLDELDVDPDHAALIALARSEAPSGESRARILAGLGAAVAAGADSSLVSASTAPPSKLGAAAWKWLLGGALAIGVPALAIALLRDEPGSASLQARTPRALPTPKARAAKPAPQPVPIEQLPLEPSVSIPRKAAAAPPRSEPTLSEELRALRAARTERPRPACCASRHW
jgi:hypothetical protein